MSVEINRKKKKKKAQGVSHVLPEAVGPAASQMRQDNFTAPNQSPQIPLKKKLPVPILSVTVPSLYVHYLPPQLFTLHNISPLPSLSPSTFTSPPAHVAIFVVVSEDEEQPTSPVSLPNRTQCCQPCQSLTNLRHNI